MREACIKGIGNRDDVSEEEIKLSVRDFIGEGQTEVVPLASSSWQASSSGASAIAQAAIAAIVEGGENERRKECVEVVVVDVAPVAAQGDDGAGAAVMAVAQGAGAAVMAGAQGEMQPEQGTAQGQGACPGRAGDRWSSRKGGD